MEWQILGWIGGALFAACAFPQAYQCWRQRHSRGISPYFLTMWFLGEVITLTFTTREYIVNDAQVLPLLVNYIFNLIAVLIIIYYFIFPKK